MRESRARIHWWRWWSLRFSRESGPRRSGCSGGPGAVIGLLVDDQLVEQLHGVVPCLLAVRLLGVELLDGRAEHLRLDHRVVRSLVLGHDALRAEPKDLADGGVVEELRQVALTGHAGVGL